MKGKAMDQEQLREYRRLAALVERQSGIRLNVDRVIKTRDEQTLRVWEKTFREKGDASSKGFRTV